jgi:hypothetical protein
MAESFYKENSHSSLSQAEDGFKDYITFFPASDLADDAQLKIAMTHIRRIEKHRSFKVLAVRIGIDQSLKGEPSNRKFVLVQIAHGPFIQDPVRLIDIASGRLFRHFFSAATQQKQK